ncbi:unnamed protein product [Clonostachys byssicola]|uniref:Uncharacterized protein n=1 Tax=Clonostachys byssicola TaxID=160290 RepID=A0A9N9XXJ9_9HYPO|nr:unnamed protein product [Clonostachys byssicola]
MGKLVISLPGATSPPPAKTRTKRIVVDLPLGARSEAGLGTIVVVGKTMSVTRGSKRESERAVGRGGAPVRGPIGGIEIERVSAGCEGWKRDAEKDLVGDGLEPLVRLDGWGDSGGGDRND